MNGCRIDSDWSSKGMRVLIHQNQYVIISILVDYGVKSFELMNKLVDHEFHALKFFGEKGECRENEEISSD